MTPTCGTSVAVAQKGWVRVRLRSVQLVGSIGPRGFGSDQMKARVGVVWTVRWELDGLDLVAVRTSANGPINAGRLIKN